MNIKVYTFHGALFIEQENEDAEPDLIRVELELIKKLIQCLESGKGEIEAG